MLFLSDDRIGECFNAYGCFICIPQRQKRAFDPLWGHRQLWAMWECSWPLSQLYPTWSRSEFSHSSLYTSICLQIIRGWGWVYGIFKNRSNFSKVLWLFYISLQCPTEGKCGLSTPLPTRVWSLFHIGHPRSFSPPLPTWGQRMDIGGPDRPCAHRKQRTAAPDQHQRHFSGLLSGDSPVLCISHEPPVTC